MNISNILKQRNEISSAVAEEIALHETLYLILEDRAFRESLKLEPRFYGFGLAPVSEKKSRYRFGLCHPEKIGVTISEYIGNYDNLFLWKEQGRDGKNNRWGHIIQLNCYFDYQIDVAEEGVRFVREKKLFSGDQVVITFFLPEFKEGKLEGNFEITDIPKNSPEKLEAVLDLMRGLGIEIEKLSNEEEVTKGIYQISDTFPREVE